MGIDLNKFKQARAAMTERLSRGGDRSPLKFWKPKPGKNTIRICPPWTNEGDFANEVWREVAQHWNVHDDSKAPILCPKLTPSIKEDCPICEFVDELKADKKNPEAQALVKQLRAKSAFFFNIVDLEDPHYTAADVAEAQAARPDSEVPFAAGDLKVQVYAAGPMVTEEIIGTFVDTETDLSDPNEGHDFFITKTGASLKTRYSVGVSLKSKPLEGFESVDQLNKLDEIGFRQEYDKLLELLTNGKGGDFMASLPSGNASAALPATTDLDDLGELPESYTGDAGDDGEDLAAELAAKINKAA